jgi:hypothetical protein
MKIRSILFNAFIIFSLSVGALFFLSYDSPESVGVGLRSYALQDASDTIIQNVVPAATDLVTSIGANKRVNIRYYVPMVVGGSMPGATILVNAPVGVAEYRVSISVMGEDSLLLSNTILSESEIDVSIPTGECYAIIDATILNGSTAGSISLDISQAQSSVAQLVVRSGAFADIIKL